MIEAFDLFYAMYEEEGELTEPEEICRLILENNLFGIDIDDRSVQIAETALWMKAFRLIGPKSPQEKDRLLREALGTAAPADTMNWAYNGIHSVPGMVNG